MIHHLGIGKRLQGTLQLDNSRGQVVLHQLQIPNSISFTVTMTVNFQAKELRAHFSDQIPGKKGK